MMKIGKKQKVIISSLLTGVLTVVSVFGTNVISEKKARVDAASTKIIQANAAITGELTGKRTKFVKQFAMSDGSYTAAIYSMPVHYKKNGKM